MGFNRGTICFHKGAYFVQVYWQGKRGHFWNVPIQGQWYPIKNRGNGEKLLRAIQEEIDRDREGFDPRSFRPGNPLRLLEYYQIWLKQIDVLKITCRDYKTAIVKYAIPFFGADKDIRNFRKAELVSFQKSIGGSEKWHYNVICALRAMNAGHIRHPSLTPYA